MTIQAWCDNTLWVKSDTIEVEIKHIWTKWRVEDLRNSSPCALKSPASLKLGWDSVIWLENKKEGKKDSTFELSVTSLVRAGEKGKWEEEGLQWKWKGRRVKYLNVQKLYIRWQRTSLTIVIIFLSYRASLITLRELPDLKACCEEPIHIYTVGPKVCGASECWSYIKNVFQIIIIHLSSVASLTTEFLTAPGSKISTSMVHQELHELGFHDQAAAHKPKITLCKIKCGMECCKACCYWTLEQWKHVL